MFPKKYLKITVACPKFGSFFVELLTYMKVHVKQIAHIQTINEKYSMTWESC